MSLATRCPACTTVFRVVDDQLKVSGGWVRCGHCDEVFNATSTLVRLADHPPRDSARIQLSPQGAAALASPSRVEDDFVRRMPPVVRPAAPQPQADQARPAQRPPPPPRPAATAAAARPVSRPANSRRPTATEPAKARRSPLTQPPPPLNSIVPSGWGTSTSFGDSIPDFEITAPGTLRGLISPEEAAKLAAKIPDSQWWLDSESPSDSGKVREEPVAPEFVRQAERSALWRHPAMRKLLLLTCGAFTVLLAAQLMHVYRGEIAARWPLTQPALSRWCGWLRCELAPPRSIESISLETSELRRTAEPGVLLLVASLRNAAPYAVRPPGLDLRFTDRQGMPTARKVLLPEQLHAPANGLPAEGGWQIEARLRVGDLATDGFTAEVFYP